MKSFFPNNSVEYFVSYYDYYQPEAYVPRTDLYIEKTSSINEQIDRMRHSATRALFERDDVIIVASVSCIYGIGSPETYAKMTLTLKRGQRVERQRLLRALVELQYRRNDLAFTRGSFRVSGDTVEIFPAHLEDRAWRLSMFGDEIEDDPRVRPAHRRALRPLDQIRLYPNSHYVTPKPTLQQAVEPIKDELKERLEFYRSTGKLLEAERIEQRTVADIEMILTTGSCPGIENYSRYLPAASRASRRRRCSSTSRRTRCCSSTRATSRCRRWAACSRATGTASRRWPSSASACRPAPTTARSSSRSGTRCGRRRSSSRPRRAPGSWSAPAASSPSR